MESPVVQQQLMWAGQRRLVLLNVPSPIKYLREKLPNKAKLGLYFNPFGKVAELIDDCIACGCDKLIEQHGGMAWDEAGFEALKGVCPRRAQRCGGGGGQTGGSRADPLP